MTTTKRRSKHHLFCPVTALALVRLVCQPTLMGAAVKTAGVRRLLFLGSSCIYPRLAPQPIQEEALLTGPLEPTNEWYAIAKIAGIVALPCATAAARL
jgi:hypothetical protein